MSETIPEGWEKNELRDLISNWGDGGTPSRSKEEYFGGNIKWVVINDIKFEIFDTKEHLTKLGFKNSSTKLWKKGSVILSTGASIGHVGIARDEMCTKQGIIGIEPSSKLNNEFLARFFEHNKSFLNRLAQGSTIKEVRIPLLGKIKILTPPLPEQEKIASILSKTDEQIQLTKEIIEKTEEQKKGLMQQLLTKGIGHTEFKEFKIDAKKYLIPNNWEIKNLEDVALIKGRVGWKGYTVEDLRTSGPLTLGANNISKKNKLDLKNSKFLSMEKYLESPEIMVKEGEILIVQRGSLGKVVIVDRPIGDATINPSMVLLKNIKMNNFFLYYYLCSEFIHRHIGNIQTQTGVPMISQKQCKDFKIIIPTNTEQEKIANVLLKLDFNIEKEKSQLQQLKYLKKGLMQDLLTGKVRVKV
jgi:type I restriction enzyme, S subunit